MYQIICGPFLPGFFTYCTFSKFIYEVARSNTLLLFCGYYSIMWIDHILNIQSSVNEHLGCCHHLNIANNVVPNIYLLE